MNSPNVNFGEIDLTGQGDALPTGISAVSLQTLGGPIGAVDLVIATWNQFKRVYGGWRGPGSSNAVLKAKRCLENGGALRVNKLVHYDDITDPDSYTAEFSTSGETVIHTLSGNLTAGHTASYTIGATQVTQVFDTDSTTTLQKLVAKILAAFGNVYTAVVVSGTRIYVVPNGANITDVLAVTGTSAPTDTRTVSTGFKNSYGGTTLFTVAPKYPGAYYDGIIMYTRAGSNGQTGYWDLVISFPDSGIEDEVYRNLYITGSPTAIQATFLKEPMEKSKWLDLGYVDLSAVVSNPIVPVPFTIKLNAGDDGDAIEDADIIGDSSAKTGLYAFDGVDDVYQVGCLEDNLSNAVHIAGASYAENRKDLQYFGFIPGDTESEVIAARTAIGTDTSYVMWFAGNHKILDPFDGTEKSIESLGDILALAAVSELRFGPWYSFSALNRGVLQNTLGADNEWGSKGNIVNLNLLANRNINVVIARSGRSAVLWGSFTGQFASSQLSLTNVRRMLIYLKKNLGPIMEAFLEEPCDIPMFKLCYLEGKTFMDPLVPKRAFTSYRWEGDQFANTMDQLKVNNSADISLGKYKVNLFVKATPSTQEILVNMILTPQGISFEDAIDIV